MALLLHGFEKTTLNQPRGLADVFTFDDPGVTLIPDVPVSLEQVLRDALAPELERDTRELEVLADLTERKREKLLQLA